MEQQLDAILELIRLFLADILEPRPIVPERRLRHGAIDLRVVDAIEFEPEEQQVRGRRGDALLHVAVKLGARRIRRVAGVEKARI